MNQISICTIIPFFNGSKYIDRAIRSATEQNYSNHEIIVVDDGSTQEESNFLDSLHKKYNFKSMKVLNQGQAAARNIGANQTEAELISFLDQDDYFLPNHHKNLLQSIDFADSRQAYVFGDPWRVDAQGRVVTHSSRIERPAYPMDDIRKWAGTNLHILPSATLIKRESFLSVGGFDSQFRGYEDDDLFFRLNLKGYLGTFTTKPVTCWTLNPESTSFSEAMSVSRFLYFKKLLQLGDDFNWTGMDLFSEALFPRFAYVFLGEAIEGIIQNLESSEDRKARLSEFNYFVSQSLRLKISVKWKFKLASLFILRLSPKQIHTLFNLLSPFAPVFHAVGYKGAKEFVALQKSKIRH